MGYRSPLRHERAQVSRTRAALRGDHPQDRAPRLPAGTDGQTTVSPANRGDVVLLEHDPLRPVGDTGDTTAVGEQLRSMRVAASFLAGRPTHLTS